MLSAPLKRALLESRHQLPPTFLLPWAANLSTASTATNSSDSTPFLPQNAARGGRISTKFTKTKEKPMIRSNRSFSRVGSQRKPDTTIAQETEDAPKLPSPNSASGSSSASPLALSSSVRELLPLMRAQGPHYITLHIQGNPYLVTEGDTVRLPYLMHDVEPGDLLRLNRAINLGSRDFTLKAPAPAPKLKSPTASSETILDPTTGTLASHSRVMPDSSTATTLSSVHAPHFIPHIAKGKYTYIDDRLFVCRALVMGVESEPMRIKEKTKRRQRHIKRVKSKHRYTILKIKELRIKSLEELESEKEQRPMLPK